MKKIKKFFTLLTGIIFTSSLLVSCGNYDDNYKIFDLWVGGVKVTTRNQGDILGDGTVSYVHTEDGGTLTFNNANIEKSFNYDIEACVVTWMDDLKINLIGENKIGLGEKTPVNGITGRNLVIEGEGSLQVGGHGSCIKGDRITINSGKITTKIFKNNEMVQGIMGVGIWAEYLLSVNGGDISVESTASYSPFSYGIYCTEDIKIAGGSINISPETAFQLGVGLIASESIEISGGNLNIYGLDDAINVKKYKQTGGSIVTTAADIFVDGACRLVHKCEILDGYLEINIMQPTISYPSLHSLDLTIGDSLSVKGGSTRETLEEKDKSAYDFADVLVTIGG